MIEAKKKAPPDKPETKATPGAKPAAKADPKPAADSKPKAKSEPQPQPKPKPEPEVEHAAPTLMNLKVLLPFRIFAEKTGVSRIVAETREGSFGLLPHRLDCVAALAPGILIYENEAEDEVYVAVDEGVLVKTGLDVLVSVRNAIGGTDLGQLREAVEREFLNLNEREQSVRSVMAKMESGFIRRLAEFHHE